MMKVACFGHLCLTTRNKETLSDPSMLVKDHPQVEENLFISSALPLSVSVSFTQLLGFALKGRQRLFN